MSENHQAGSQPGVASMVGGIVEDVQKLVRQEIALAQREVAQAWDKGKTAAALLASALVAFMVGGVLLGIMAAKLLDHWWPNHEWACFGIVGSLVALLGAALVYYGVHRINEVHVSLPQTTEPLPEDAQALGAAAPRSRSSPEPLLKR
jgi:protein-S-isoprenylcysteine O-methyltransferase Ste14